MQTGGRLTVFEVELVLIGSDTRFGIRQRLVAETVLCIVVVEVVGVLERTRDRRHWV